MTGALAGIRILEFATTLSGPLGTMILGDQGADVIKVEAPTGDQLRSAGHSRGGVEGFASAFLNTNRNKRSIVLDLKTADDLLKAQALAAQCDVVVQNFRPGVMDRLGLGYQAIKALNDDVIYVSIDGAGGSGPGAGRRYYDVVVQGMTGYAATQAGGSDGAPEVIKNAVVDKATSLNVAQAICAALVARERQGIGQHIHVSMLSAALSFLWPESLGEITFRGPNVVPSATMASSRYIFATRDGHIIAGFVTDGEWRALCAALSIDAAAEHPRFATMAERYRNISEANAIVADAIASWTTADLLARLGKTDAVFAPVNAVADIPGDEQIRAAGAILDLEHPIAGAYRQPAPVALFSETRSSIRRHAPLLGEHGTEIAEEFGIGGETA